MSVSMAGESRSSAAPYVQPFFLGKSNPSVETTYRKAINQIRKNMKSASPQAVHIYRFNVPLDQLDNAYSLLDKDENRSSMRVTYSDKHNFIVRYMPSAVHDETCVFWNTRLPINLSRLTAPSDDIGCYLVGQKTIQLGPRKKQPDSGLRPFYNPSGVPSIVVEVGSSESLMQLKIDARLWLEHLSEVRLVILISVDPPIPPFPNFPTITIELWRSFPLHHPQCSTQTTLAQERELEASKVWAANWTHTPTPFYILLSDIFRGPPPASYGNNDRVYLDTQAWRMHILENYY